MAERTLVDAPDVLEVVQLRRAGDGEPDQREIGEHVARREVEVLGPTLAPRCQLLSHGEIGTTEVAHLLDATPRLGRIAGAAGLRDHLRRRLDDPADPTALLQLGGLLGVECPQVGDIRGGIDELPVGQRPAQPVGEAIGLRRPDAELALEERGQRGARVTEEPRGELGVEHPARRGAGGVFEHLEVLASGMQDRQGVGLEHGAHRRRIDGERVDEVDDVIDLDLDQRQLREIRAFAVELGVDRVRVGRADLLDERGECRGGGDQVVGRGRRWSRRASHAPSRSPRRAPNRSTPWCRRRCW